MLNDTLKAEIQDAYRQFLELRELKPRSSQRYMIAEIAKALGAIEADGEGNRTSSAPACVIEAGTGTGKTVAYLLATIPIAKALEKTVVVSTATIALQEQIVHKDLPDLRQHSGLNFSFILAKGRGRYLCVSRLNQLMADNPQQSLALFETADFRTDKLSSETYQALEKAFRSGRWNGERDSWKEPLDDALWQSLTIDHARCLGRNCEEYEECVFYQARENLHKADVVVANHDLVLADLALGGGAILPPPESCIYVFDEGHHLAQKALNHFSEFVRLKATQNWLEEVVQLLPSMSKELEDDPAIAKELSKLPEVLSVAKQQSAELYQFLESMHAFDSTDDRAHLMRLKDGVVPESLAELAEVQHQVFLVIEKALTIVEDDLNQALEGKHTRVNRGLAERWYPTVALMLTRIEANRSLWQAYAQEDKDDQPPRARWLNWVASGNDYDLELACSPIIAAQTLSYYLWSRCYGAVVTSATLTALGRFDRFRQQSGLSGDNVFARFASPFDYPNKATLHVPQSAADPKNEDAHTSAIAEFVSERLDRNVANLVLFSSRWQMRAVLERLDDECLELVLDQDSYPKQQLIKTHKQRIDDGEGSIIFGLATFAEGVDLPGEYCEHVVIVRLPFAVPDDPVEAALVEWIEKRGGNSFMEVTVPDASMRLVQAVGRLIRTEADEGRVTLLDRRVTSRRYGAMLLDSLPPMRREIEA